MVKELVTNNIPGVIDMNITCVIIRSKNESLCLFTWNNFISDYHNPRSQGTSNIQLFLFSNAFLFGNAFSNATCIVGKRSKRPLVYIMATSQRYRLTPDVVGAFDLSGTLLCEVGTER